MKGAMLTIPVAGAATITVGTADLLRFVDALGRKPLLAPL